MWNDENKSFKLFLTLKEKTSNNSPNVENKINKLWKLQKSLKFSREWLLDKKFR